MKVKDVILSSRVKEVLIKVLIVVLLVLVLWNVGVLQTNKSIQKSLNVTKVELSQKSEVLEDREGQLENSIAQYKALESKFLEMESRFNSLNAQYQDVIKQNQQLSRGGAIKFIEYEATAYTHTGNPTKTGVMPKTGVTIAVDPRYIPLGSKVYIEGLGWRIAEDTGRLIKGQIIDVFLNSEAECKEFGRKKIQIYIQK